MKLRDLSDAEKCVLCLALTFIMGLLLVYTYIDEQESDYPGIIRLHVIANSDSPADQALKLEVRDAVIAYMNEQDDLADTDAVRDYLRDNLSSIENLAGEVIASGGRQYTVTAGLGVRYIPRRTYGDITFPAGNYEALDITIGSGQGENWWCVLFPPLCLLDEGSESVDDLPANDLTGEQKEQQLLLRWKLLQLLRQQPPKKTLTTE